MSLFVGNLSPQVQHRELERTFRRFGRCNLELKDGYGFVIYEIHREAERALRALQGKTICRERPSISWARSQRPFQRFSGKGSSFRRNSLDKDQAFVESGSRRRRSQDIDKVIDDSDRKGHRESDQEEEGRDGLGGSEPRGDANENGTKEDEWKAQATTGLILEGDEPKESDPLDGGRWGELPSDGSPDHGLVDDARDYHEDLPDREKDDVEGTEKDVRVKVHGSPAERSHVRSSHSYRTTEEHSRRGRDFFGRDSFSKPQERCYNCGQFGHVMRQCRSRAKLNIFYRDGARRDGFDGRRHQVRGIRGNGFRRPGGRFRGIEGSRRGFNREMDVSYARRNLTRQSGDRKLHEHIDIPSRARSRRRHHHSESNSDTHSKERSKKRRKKLRKRSTSRAARKRRRSSSSSSSSSSPSSKSKSRSHSRSSSSSRSPARSQSAASRSRSIKSHSRSLGSRSLSRRSRSASSRSHSASSSSRSVSHSRTSRSGQSQSKSHSGSSKSRTRSVSLSRTPRAGSQSPNSHGLPSRSSAPLNTDSKGSHGSSLEGPARSSKSRGLQTSDIEGGPVHSGTLTDAKQIENKRELLETVGPLRKKSWQFTERQALKRPRFESEAGLTEGKHQEGIGDSKRGNIGPAHKDMEELRYSSGEQDEEKDLERSIVGSRDSRQYLSGNRGLKCRDESVLGTDQPSNGGNLLSGHHDACLEEAVRRQDISAGGSMHDGLTKDDSDAKQPVGRNVGSPGVPTFGGFVTKGAEHESILSLSEYGGWSQDLEPVSFSAARLWPWEAILFRRLKRGPISVSNYERRKAQNEEFHIVDKFVRSSTGWWERSE